MTIAEWFQAAWQVLVAATAGAVSIVIYQARVNRGVTERLIKLEVESHENVTAHERLAELSATVGADLRTFREESATQHADMARKVDANTAALSELVGYLKGKREFRGDS